jgi:hypothetical protein
MLGGKAGAPMESYRDALVRELAELEAQLKEMAGFVGFMGGAGTVSDDSGELIRSLKDKIADIKSELEEMDDDA